MQQLDSSWEDLVCAIDPAQRPYNVLSVLRINSLIVEQEPRDYIGGYSKRAYPSIMEDPGCLVLVADESETPGVMLASRRLPNGSWSHSD
jgi:hypothetical protein